MQLLMSLVREQHMVWSICQPMRHSQRSFTHLVRSVCQPMLPWVSQASSHQVEVRVMSTQQQLRPSRLTVQQIGWMLQTSISKTQLAQHMPQRVSWIQTNLQPQASTFQRFLLEPPLQVSKCRLHACQTPTETSKIPQQRCNLWTALRSWVQRRVS